MTLLLQVGVVGRTGAGKHSIVAAILRLFEPQGVIRIDGVDTGTLSLKVSYQQSSLCFKLHHLHNYKLISH